MPQLVAAAFWAIEPIVGGAIAKFAIDVATFLLISAATSKLFAPKIPSASSRLGGHSVMTRSATEYRRIVYGSAIISGPIVYNNTSGATRQDLWYMIALCEGEIEEFTKFYVDDIEVAINEIDWTPGAGGADGTGTGAVSTNKFVDDGNNGLYLFYGLGNANQQALAPMVAAFGEWTSAHRLRGVAYLAAKCVYEAATEQVWQTGAPQNFRAVVSGRKIYDPRLDSTRPLEIASSTTTDDFERASLGANWDDPSQQYYELPVIANSSEATGPAEYLGAGTYIRNAAAIHASASLGDNQRVSATVTNVVFDDPTGDWCTAGLWLRASSDLAGDNTGYLFIVGQSGEIQTASGDAEFYASIQRLDSPVTYPVDGNWKVFSVNGSGLSNGDTIKFEAIGNELRGYLNDELVLTWNDDTYSGSGVGFWLGIGGEATSPGVLASDIALEEISFSTLSGSGPQRFNDSSTWEWSDNPALCLADYLTQVMGVAEDSIDWQSVVTAANHCDQLVAITTASPQGTEKRFTCNGVISFGDSHKDNIDKLLSGMAGTLSYVGGEWVMRASVWEASSVSYTASDFAGGIEIRGSAPKSERSNKVRGVFVNPSADYEVTEFPPVINSTYLTRDNSVVITKDLELPVTNSRTMAQRIAFRMLAQDNNQVIVKATLNKRGAKCTVGDVVDLTLTKYSWTSKTFRVIEWQRNGNGTYDVTLKEDSSASYTDPDATDYIDGDSANITLPSEVVPPPTGLSTSSVPYAIRLNWSNPATMEFDYMDVYASETSAWSGATRIASVRTDTYTHSLTSGSVRYYWIRARRNNGDVSTRLPDSDTSTVSGTAGTQSDAVDLTGATLSDERVTSTTEVGYQLTSGGLEQSYTNPSSPISWSTIATWLVAGSAANYECRLTKTSGTDPTSGNLATWEALSSTRGWVWQDATQNDTPVTFAGIIEIRDVSQSPAPVYASANINVTVDSQNPNITLTGGDPTASPIGTPNTTTDTDEEGVGTADAGWRFNPDGTIDRYRISGWTYFGDWTNSVPSPVPYFIRATSIDGDAPDGGSTGIWLAMTSARSWQWQQSTVGSTSGTIRVEIADGNSPQGVLATGYYKATSTIFPGG